VVNSLKCRIDQFYFLDKDSHANPVFYTKENKK